MKKLITLVLLASFAGAVMAQQAPAQAKSTTGTDAGKDKKKHHHHHHDHKPADKK